VLTVLTALVPAAAPARAARPTGLVWSPCAEDATVQCATLQVPIDWADPYAAKVGIAVARRPATDPAARIGALIVNPGGPGGSGVDLAVDSPYFFTAALRKRFDIVGFDPRGVSRSNPVRCSAALSAAAPAPLITSPQAYAATIAYNNRLAADCRANTGPVFGHVDTFSVVRDTDALRAALDEPRLTFYGASYGTLIGEQYSARYPSRVRAIVLDSVMDHSVGTGGFLEDTTDAAQDSFNQFIGWCGRNATCAVHGRDVPEIWARLLARAAAGELRDPFTPTDTVRVSDLLTVAFSSFYDPQWSALGYYLKEADAQPVEPPGPAVPAPSGLTPNSFAAVFCEDWSLSVGGYADYHERLARLRERAPQMLASPLALRATAGCLGWPSRPDNPQWDLGRAKTPILLVNARHDPATAYSWAQHVAEQLGPQAVLLTYDGWGHVAYNHTACVSAVVDSYLIDGALPEPGTHCPGVLPVPSGIGGSVPEHATTGQRGTPHWGYR
jgi:pimeloyl-ACP methyl ester carboxylesterase